MKNYIIKPKKFDGATFGNGFDASKLSSFDTFYGVILWSCLKSGHITDQYFDENVCDFIKTIQSSINTDSFLEFREVIRGSSLRDFSRENTGLWLMIFRLLQEPNLFTFNLNGTNNSLNKETLKLFKPEQHI